MTAKDHNRLLSIFFLIQGGLQLFIGILMAAIYGGVGGVMLSTARKQEEQMVGGIFVVLAVCIGILLAVFAGFYLFTGFKLLKERRIGRTLGIVASCLALLGFPLGTALGIYGLWFLFGDLGKQFYSAGNSAPGYSHQPPPPSGWQ